MAAREGWPDDDPCEVTECPCGHLTLRVGRVRVDLSREEFALLRDRLAQAAAARGLVDRLL